jgi:hypothetical protein
MTNIASNLAAKPLWQVPADPRLPESRDLHVTQALLTGEPYPPAGPKQGQQKE